MGIAAQSDRLALFSSGQGTHTHLLAGFRTAASKIIESATPTLIVSDGDRQVAIDIGWVRLAPATERIKSDSSNNIQRAGQQGSWLPNAMKDLVESHDEAIEDGYEPASAGTRDTAAYLLREFSERVKVAPMVYATREGAIAIDFRSPGTADAFLVLCEPEGEVACFYEMDGKYGRFRCSDARDVMKIGAWNILDHLGIV